MIIPAPAVHMVVSPDGGLKQFWHMLSQKQIHGGQTVGESPVVYEASIWYYLDRRSARGVHAILPCSKLLWIFRNPLPRARSHYYHIHGADQSKILGWQAVRGSLFTPCPIAHWMTLRPLPEVATSCLSCSARGRRKAGVHAWRAAGARG